MLFWVIYGCSILAMEHLFGKYFYIYTHAMDIFCQFTRDGDAISRCVGNLAWFAMRGMCFDVFLGVAVAGKCTIWVGN